MVVQNANSACIWLAHQPEFPKEVVLCQGIRKGTWDMMSNGSVKILYKYKGEIVVITGKVVDKIFRIGDAWVWNGSGTP